MGVVQAIAQTTCHLCQMPASKASTPSPKTSLLATHACLVLHGPKTANALQNVPPTQCPQPCKRSP
eukprot:12939048-Prorocentrum_lima.AAC.1